jgi:voltage-gated potassium channel
MLLRKTIAFYLEDLSTPVGQAVNIIITGLILISSAIFVAETFSLPDAIRIQLDILDSSILLIFAVEYLLRFWCAEQNLKHLFSLYYFHRFNYHLAIFFRAT